MERSIGGVAVSGVGLGCMNFSHGYGVPPSREDAVRVIRRALDLGVTHFDTAALYGFGHNETLVGDALGADRHRVFLASKGGLAGVDGKRTLDGRPATLIATCEAALLRLKTDVIDLYYLHRWDRRVPLEDSVGALADLVTAGKIRFAGLSEVSAATLRRAHAVHPIAAVQSEYSLFTRNAERGAIDACREIGAAFVAFSPLSRGFLCGAIDGVYAPGDLRADMARFSLPYLPHNLALARDFLDVARSLNVAPSALALAWVLHRDAHVTAIFGTTSPLHLEENLGALRLKLDAQTMARIEAAADERKVQGARYPASAQSEVDTEA